MAGLLLGLRRQLSGNRQKGRTGNTGSEKAHRGARPVGQNPAGLRAGTAGAQEDGSFGAGSRTVNGDAGNRAVSDGSGIREAEHRGGVREAGIRREPLRDMDTAMQAEAVSNTCERTQDIVNRDDDLLQQIDEFRDRAQQLQSLMNDREEELRQLEQRRQEQERRRRQRQQEEPLLTGQELKRAEPDREMELHPIDLCPQARPIQPEQPVSVRETEPGIFESQMQRLEQIMQERDESTAGFTAEVERKIDEMIAKVSAKMNELDESVRESVDGGNQISAERARELKESLEQLQEQLASLKAELSDKVHSENVKCYRNIQELLRNLEKKLDAVEVLEQQANSARTFLVAVLIFTILNFVAVIGMMLVQLGVFAV